MNKYLKKRIKIRDENLKYDFLPSMTEIIERPANKLTIVILFSVIGLLGTALLWAAYFRIDIAVSAYGTVMPDSGVVEMNSIKGGKIQEIYVEDGAYVKAGDVLLVLESEECDITIKEYQYNLSIVDVQLELYQKIYTYLCRGEEEITFGIETEDYEGYQNFVEEILLEKNIYDREIERTYNIGDKERILEEYKLKILEHINELEIKKYSIEFRLQEAENQLEQYTVRATAEGKVVQMQTFFVDGLMKAGEPFGYIIPNQRKQIFRAYIPDESVRQIVVGDNVQVKIAAYKDTDYEYMEGIVLTVDDMAVNREGYGAVYTVDICIDNLPEDIRVGMEGHCDIIVGSRTVLEYFMEPFIEGFGNSMKER